MLKNSSGNSDTDSALVALTLPLGDHLGSVRAVTNQWGSPLYMFDYDVFGQPLQDRPERFRHGFTGKEFDSWTGLYDYGFRDYAPLCGRFTTVDPIQDGHNWYAYVNSDPVSWLDPWGLECPDQESGADMARNADSNGRGWKFSSENIEALETGIKNVQENIGYLVEEVIKGLEDSQYNIQESIVTNAKDCVGLDLAKYNDKILFLEDIARLSETALTLDISKMHTSEPKPEPYGAWVNRYDSDHNIYFPPLFSLVFSGLSEDTVESLLFHEISHFADSLNIIDDYEIKRLADILERIPENKRRLYAQAWHWFYLAVFEGKK